MYCRIQESVTARGSGFSPAVPGSCSDCPVSGAVYSGEPDTHETGGKPASAADCQGGGLQCTIPEADAGGLPLHTSGESPGNGGAGGQEGGRHPEGHAENLGQGGIFRQFCGRHLPYPDAGIFSWGDFYHGGPSVSPAGDFHRLYDGSSGLRLQNT